MNHSSREELQSVLTQGECAAIFHHNGTFCWKSYAKKTGNHLESLCTCHHLDVRISIEHELHIRRMVGFHVAHNQIVWLTVFESTLQILHPVNGLASIDGVENRYFLIYDKIGIIGNTFWNSILTFEEVKLLVVGTNILDAWSNHIFSHFNLIFL